MSCSWRFECLSHDPHIVGEPFTNHTDDDRYKNAIELAKSRPLEELFSDIIDHWYDTYDYNARVFLTQHVKCDLGIVNEYGEHLTLNEVVSPGGDIPCVSHPKELEP